MNATNIDWIVTGVFLIALTMGGLACRHFIKGVADWTVAGRHLRKFLGLSTGTAEGMGLITIAASAEIGFTSGFANVGVSVIILLTVPLVYGCTGFVINRYRRARVVTVPEYAERRYSKGVRVITAFVLAFSGVLNLAIFPIMASQFLTYFLDVPARISCFGIDLPFVPLLMAVLIALALLFAYTGGMVSVILTDYVQSIIIALMVFLTTVLVIKDIGFAGIHETINANFGEKGYNPLTSDVFGPLFLLWLVLQQILGFPAFAPTMQKLASTDSEKTARHMTILAWVFGQGRYLMLLLWGIGALAVLGPEAPQGLEESMYAKVAGAIYIGRLLPPVILGITLAGMLAAFISTVDSYFLTWSTVIVNDIICPLRTKPISPRAHMWLLRMLVGLIAIALYVFGVLYRPEENLLSYLMLTGTMMLGAGIILIGGLYWRRASTMGAYAAVIFCGIIPVIDLLLRRVNVGDMPRFRPQEFGLLAILLAIVFFVAFSLLFPGRPKAPEKR